MQKLGWTKERDGDGGDIHYTQASDAWPPRLGSQHGEWRVLCHDATYQIIFALIGQEKMSHVTRFRKRKKWRRLEI